MPKTPTGSQHPYKTNGSNKQQGKRGMSMPESNRIILPHDDDYTIPPQSADEVTLVYDIPSLS